MSMQIPEIPSGNFFGHFKSYVRDPLAFLQKHLMEYGDIFTFRVARRRLIYVNHPDHIRQILQDNHRNYKKSNAYRKLALLLGDGLFTSDGTYWRNQRRTIQPAFHRDQIKTYAEVMHDFSMIMVERWKKQKEIDLANEMTEVTLRIISKTMLDMDLITEGKTVGQHLPFALKFMVNSITSPLAAPIWIPTKDNRKFVATVKILDKLIQEIIQQKKENLSLDLLSQLILLKNEDTGTGLTDMQLRDEVMTLFLAGHETTAMGMTWILNHLLRDNKLKERMVAEVKKLRNSWDAVGNYYIQNVINEALRLYAPVWILAREAEGDDQLGEYAIHGGDRIIFSPYLTHRHPDFWENPEKFDPSRFDKEVAHRYAYFPFGGGPRVCIGQYFALMEMTILLVNILKNFPEMRLKSREQVGYDYSITLRPDREIRVELGV
jgi:cytochrome P450